MKNLTTIFLTSLLVGTLDITAAIIHFKLNGGDNPVRIFYFIASGVFGNKAFDSGENMAFLGLVFHYLIAGTWTLFYFLIYPFTFQKIGNRWVSGIAYGVFIWIIMNLIVLPFSNTPEISRNLTQDLIGVAILVLAIGLPVAFVRSRSTSN
jgi:hypothetical protein